MKRLQLAAHTLILAATLVIMAKAGTTVLITPPWQRTEVGSITTVRVYMDSVAQLRVYSIQVQYDPSRLRCERVEKLGLFSPAGSLFFFRIDTLAGIVTMDEGIIGPVGFTGSGSMTALTFRALRNGVTDLQFIQVNLRDTANHALPSQQHPAQIQVGGPSSVHGASDSESLSLRGFPNPFNAGTTISFVLPQRAAVKLSVFDVTGAMVKQFVNGSFDPGQHTLYWNGTDAVQRPVGSSVYYLVLDAGTTRIVRPVVHLK